MWVSEHIPNRDKFGAFNTFLPELYFQYLRMDVDIFQGIVCTS